jgi:hypothetical protein
MTTTTAMTDLEMIKKCAEKMGLDICQNNSKSFCMVKFLDCDAIGEFEYDPIHDDAQAMALVKKFRLNLYPYDVVEGREWCVSCPDPKDTEYFFFQTYHQNLNTAIVECVSKLP